MSQGTRLDFSFSPSAQANPKRRSGNAPFKLLVLGDFTGLPADDRTPLAQRQPRRVDLDSFDALMARWRPQCTWDNAPWVFTSLDDLHPDALLQRPAFQTLRTEAASAAEQGGALLGQLLGGAPAGLAGAAKPASTPPATAASGVDAFIRALLPATAPTPTDEPQRQATVHQALGDALRALLHSPDFQRLDRAWRGLHWLVQTLPLDDGLEIHALDVAQAELWDGLKAAEGRWADTGWHRAMAGDVANPAAWSMLLGLQQFGAEGADLALLAALGLSARAMGAPYVAAGSTDLALLTGPAQQAWQALRASEAAPWLGLVAPRVLLRRPYGRRSDPVELPGFEEFSGRPAHEQLLWGSGALAVGLLVAQAFAESGWDFQPGDHQHLDDLPQCTFEQDGEVVLQACAEAYLSDHAGQSLLDAGLMPLLSHKHRNAVSLMRCQSIAQPAQPLAGLPRGG